MLIHIVTHCYAEKLPFFAVALRYQLSSLVIHKPKHCDVGVTVHHVRSDKAVVEVIDDFNGKLSLCYFEHQTAGELGRRSIGRNHSALSCLYGHADLVWFTDCDHVFGEGCLDVLALNWWPDGASMVHPWSIQIHKDHVTGDAALKQDGRLLDIDPKDFVPKRYHKAIGGVQIVLGPFAREHGYLRDDPKWQQPAEKPFGDFRDDVAYRKFCARYGTITGIELKNLFRIRHTATTYQDHG